MCNVISDKCEEFHETVIVPTITCGAQDLEYEEGEEAKDFICVIEALQSFCGVTRTIEKTMKN